MYYEILIFFDYLKYNIKIDIFLSKVLFILSLCLVNRWVCLGVDIAESSHYTNVMGLSNNSVNVIFQDKNKFIWIGTNDGLNFFDGYSFKVYKNKSNDSTSISDNAISCIFQDSQKKIWVGTIRGGISIYNPLNDGFIRINDVYNKGVLTNGFITGIIEDEQGYIWIATISGLNRYNPTNGNVQKFYSSYADSLVLQLPIIYKSEFPADFIDMVKKVRKEGNTILKTDLFDLCLNTYGFNKAIELSNLIVKYLSGTLSKSLLDNKLRAITTTKDGSIILGYEYGGISKLNTQTCEFTHYIYQSKSNTRPKDRNIFSIYVSGNEVYAGNNDGTVDIINLKTKIFSPVSGLPDMGHISQINEFEPGLIFIGGYNNIVIFNTKDKSVVDFADFYPNHKSISTLGITSFITDNQRNRWVGTFNNGVFLISRPNVFKVIGKEHNIVNDIITSIYIDKNKNFWIGYLKSGISLFDKNFKKIKSFEHLPQFKGNESFTFFQDNVQAIYTLSNKSGLMEYKFGSGTFSTIRNVKSGKIDIPLDNIRKIVKIRDGEYWLATFGDGLIKYDFKNNVFKNIRADYIRWQYNIPSDWTYDLIKDKNNILWLATTNGLSKIDPVTEEIETFNKLNSKLQHDVINCLYVDKHNNLWVGTKGGLFIIDNKTQEQYLLTNEHGLPSNDIKAIIQDKDSRLWISTDLGIFSVQPYSNLIFSLDQIKRSIRKFDIYDGLSSNEFSERAIAIDDSGTIYMGSSKGISYFNPKKVLINEVPPSIYFTNVKLFNEPVQVNMEIDGHVILSKPLFETDTIIFDYDQNILTFEFQALNYIQSHKNQYKYKLKGFNENWNYIGHKNEANYTNLEPGVYELIVKAANNDGIWNEEGRTLTIIIRPPYWKTWWFRLLLILITLSVIVLFYYIRLYQINMKNKVLTTIVEERTKEISEKNKILMNQANDLNATNTLLEERQQQIEEQAEELMAQRDELSSLNATKDKLFSILAHDLKNPFNTILGFSELLLANLNRYSKEKIETQVRLIRDASRHTFELLENLLHWSRQQRGLIEFEPTDVDINNCISGDIKILNQQAERKEIKIEYIQKGNPAPVLADENMLNIILRNLLSNAIKYSFKNNKVLLEITYQKDDVKISVTDYGVGISQDMIRNIQSMSSNVSNPGTTGEKGTGLGLLLCVDFINLHGSSLSIESEVGKFTTFLFKLPYYKV